MSVSSDAQECCFCPQENRGKESPNTVLALCPHCREVFYCSEEHFRLHRSYDGSTCLPFRVIQTEDRGRIMVATRQVLYLCSILLTRRLLTSSPNFSLHKLSETRKGACIEISLQILQKPQAVRDSLGGAVCGLRSF